MLHSFICAFALGTVSQPPVQNPTLAEERSGPFSYYRVPSDVVGFKDCPQGFQLTYDGALNNGFGEFQILAGEDPWPINQRVKTLYKGCYPIPEFSFKRDGAVYRVRIWATPKNLDPRENLIAYVQIEVVNPGDSVVAAGIGARYVARGKKGRCEMPCREWYRDRFMDFQAWSSSLVKSHGGGTWDAGAHTVFAAEWPSSPNISDGKESNSFVSGTAVSGAATKWPFTSFRFRLKPHSQYVVTFKVPFVPISESHPQQVRELRTSKADVALKRTVSFWKGIYDRTASVVVPEQKVSDLYRANLAYMLIARDVLEDGKSFMQTVNKFQYHDFYFRDGAYFVRVYDMLGLHDVAAETVEYYLNKDEAGKPFDLKRIGVDDWGQSLWALGLHFRSTGDLAFARRIYPVLAPHMAYYRDRIGEDPLGLWPKLGPYDAELLEGHYTSHSFWVLLGLREAANIARALGKTDDAGAWTKLHDEYRGRFLAQLKKVTDSSGGYIPPGIDDPAAGRDWENATGGVYPFGVLPASDPRVAYTVKLVRDYKWREGISTWGTNAWVLKREIAKGLEPKPGTLHDYETYNTMETMLALGMQREALEDFYSTLVHTSSTHAGFEMSTEPWGERDTQGNYPPHGWFAARTVEFIRNMMVREEGQTLHLASALSPVWVQAGKVVRVRGMATDFGLLSFTLRSRPDGATVDLASKWRSGPSAIEFHVPWYLKATSAKVDGKEVAVRSGAVTMPADARHLELQWVWLERPDLSYRQAVELWLEKNYRSTPDTDRNFLFPRAAYR